MVNKLIRPATLPAGEDEVLQIKTLRRSLEPRDSPFVKNNNSGGGFGAFLNV